MCVSVKFGFARLLLILAVFCVGLLGFSTPTRAQQFEPTSPPPDLTGYWKTVIPGYNNFARAGSPDEACRIQHDAYNPNATYQAPTFVRDTTWLCNWVARQFGGPSDSGYVLPTNVHLACLEGTTRQGGVCVPIGSFDPECADECADKGVADSPFLKVGNPISVASGYKILNEIDYTSADGLLRVDRHYLSRPWGNATPSWRVLIPGFLDVNSTGSGLTFRTLGGGTNLFGRRSDWSWGVSGGPSRRRLSMIETPSVNADTYFRIMVDVDPEGPPEMRLDMPNGDYILFRRANGRVPSSIMRRLVPVEHGLAGGYARYFDYSDDGFFPYRVRDSLGRQLQITWRDTSVEGGAFYGPEKAISKIDLPDGTSLNYDYDVPTHLFPGAITLSFATANAGSEGTAKISALYSSGRITGTYELAGQRDRLRKVEHRDANGVVLWGRSYDYAGGYIPNALEAIRDQNGQILAEYQYNGWGRVTRSSLAGDINTYTASNEVWVKNSTGSLDLRKQRRTITNPLGRVQRYEVQRVGTKASEPFELMKVEGFATADVEADERVFQYWPWGGGHRRLYRFSDENGHWTQYALDHANRRPTSVTEAHGLDDVRITDMEWHPVWDLPTRVERDGVRVEVQYTENALVASQTVTDTTTHSQPYSTNGQSRTIQYSWGSDARLLSVNGPRPVDAQGRDDTVDFTYDAVGNVVSITNGLGHVTTFAGYDANGRPGSMTDPNGTVTEFSYDGRGRATSMRVKHPSDPTQDAVTSFAYDIEGRVKTVTAPASSPLTMNYNLAGLLTSIVASNGERIDFAHDAMGNVTSQSTVRTNGTSANSITRTFDALGRMLTETLGPGRTWTYAYDKVGNLVGTTSPRNQSTALSFDALDRLVATALPDGGAPAFAYDDRDNMTRHDDAIGVETAFVHNGFGEVIQEISPDRGTSTYVYDGAGDLVSATDGRGQTVDYTYDILGRPVSAAPAGRPASETVTYTWDSPAISGSSGIGRLSQVDDSGTTIQYGYDHRGNTTMKRQRIGTDPWLTLEFDYDLADRRTQIGYPSGRVVNYTYDTLGRITQIRTKDSSAASAWTVLASGMEYEAFGAMTRADYGNGLRLVQSWGNDGRLASKRLERGADGVALSSLAYQYDNTDNIVQIADTIDPTNTRDFVYDPMERLERLEGDFGSYNFVYDANGNRLEVESRATSGASTSSQIDTYTIAPGTNRLTDVTTVAGTRSYTHDGRGNQIAEVLPDGSIVAVSYDGHGRLSSYAEGSSSQSMLYNGADERVRVETDFGPGQSDTRVYVYDLDHRIIGEYGAGGVLDFKAEYIWMLPGVGAAGALGGDDGAGGYMPLAVALGQAAPGSSSELMWVHGNHLGTPLVTSNALGQEVAPAGFAAIGFPGQFANAEQLAGAAHYYNRHRDYDPLTGRYIQADPIGLAGDANPYTYAEGNPVSKIDPLGLQAATAGEVADAAFDWWVNRQRRPSRATPWGRVWSAGEAIGAATAVGLYLYRNGGIPLPPQCPDDADCEEEWAEAIRICARRIGDPNWRGVTGGYGNLFDCARGLVSERCGGNPVNHRGN